LVRNRVTTSSNSGGNLTAGGGLLTSTSSNTGDANATSCVTTVVNTNVTP
jgi:hypothetical protein